MSNNEKKILLKVKSRVKETNDVVSLEFVSADGEALPSWQAGAHIDLIFDDQCVRQYSLCGPLDDNSVWRIGVLLAPNSRGGSQRVHELREGDTVLSQGPRNHFELVSAQQYLFIAGGIGITPILAMVDQAEKSGADWKLVYGGRDRASMAYLGEIEKYTDKVFLEPQAEVGHINLAGWIGGVDDSTYVYCCGPEPLLHAVEEHCKARHINKLVIERFAARAQAEPVMNETFEVILQQSGLTLQVKPGQTILHVVEAAGVYVTASCCEGVCGSCETMVIRGIPEHRDSVLTDDEKSANDRMLICVSRAMSSELVLDL
ncbi:PDR/VanB family oxidoreductase [Rouxiella badensis]|uniref:PDR/VanB family oxidoreductase n=1 Tax=Rouxiella badensis TaxID=1646377 RepID=UPI0022AA2D8B|nr:PDR/VanB family oxidoreductase [Rouxiella badensis]WAT09673.1 PDR/VanB family oxidoreductase [Rouxiella badensis]